jgi:hypothetical protein
MKFAELLRCAAVLMTALAVVAAAAPECTATGCSGVVITATNNGDGTAIPRDIVVDIVSGESPTTALRHGSPCAASPSYLALFPANSTGCGSGLFFTSAPARDEVTAADARRRGDGEWLRGTLRYALPSASVIVTLRCGGPADAPYSLDRDATYRDTGAGGVAYTLSAATPHRCETAAPAAPHFHDLLVRVVVPCIVVAIVAAATLLRMYFRRRKALHDQWTPSVDTDPSDSLGCVVERRQPQAYAIEVTPASPETTGSPRTRTVTFRAAAFCGSSSDGTASRSVSLLDPHGEYTAWEHPHNGGALLTAAAAVPWPSVADANDGSPMPRGETAVWRSSVDCNDYPADDDDEADGDDRAVPLLQRRGTAEPRGADAW